MSPLDRGRGAGGCKKLAPQPPLLGPVELGGDRLQPRQVDRIASAALARQEQELFLEIRREVQQVQNLANACAGHMPQPGQLSEAGNLAFAEKHLEAQRADGTP